MLKGLTFSTLSAQHAYTMTFGPHLEKKTNCIPEAVARINSAENNKISPNNTTDHNLDLGSSEILTMFFFDRCKMECQKHMYVLPSLRRDKLTDIVGWYIWVFPCLNRE